MELFHLEKIWLFLVEWFHREKIWLFFVELKLDLQRSLFLVELKLENLLEFPPLVLQTEFNREKLLDPEPDHLPNWLELKTISLYFFLCDSEKLS